MEGRHTPVQIRFIALTNSSLYLMCSDFSVDIAWRHFRKAVRAISLNLRPSEFQYCKLELWFSVGTTWVSVPLAVDVGL